MSLVTILIIIAIITIIRIHPTIIDPTNKVVILNNWKVKFKTTWDNVFIYKYEGNKYENCVNKEFILQVNVLIITSIMHLSYICRYFQVRNCIGVTMGKLLQGI